MSKDSAQKKEEVLSLPSVLINYGKSLSQLPLVQASVEDLIASYPPEMNAQINLETDHDFVDFCETNQVPKKIEITYKAVKEELIRKLLFEINKTTPRIGRKFLRDEDSSKILPASLNIEKTVIKRIIKSEEVVLSLPDYRQETLVILLDNSTSITFSRKLDIAKGLGLILKSYYRPPHIKLMLFSEQVKMVEYRAGSIEHFLRSYLQTRGRGFTDFSFALNQFQNELKKVRSAKGIIISDGVSSVGQKSFWPDFPEGKIHYIKLGNKKTEVDTLLQRIIFEKRGRFIELNKSGTLFTPLYQIIKRL